jgi:hypothetical protein
MVLAALRVEWRCVLEVGGAQSVMMAGTSLMLAWSADNWDYLLQVRNLINDLLIEEGKGRGS